MTDRQARFVAEYLVDLNATQAAIRAGYSEKNAAKMGARLMAKKQVAEAIAKEKAARGAKAGRQALDVLNDIVALTREAREAGDLKTALKGLELEGKHLGMFRERIDAQISGGFSIRWED